ncbi:MAG: hypothetical protein O9275_20685, partial [Microcystis sp. LE19-196.1B]|nr:hypothetical protein [Microcystis sp. LE19-196.1B]
MDVTDDKATTGPTYESGDENENDVLDVGETWTYSASSTVTQADVDAGSFTNEATATGTPAGGTLEPAKGSKTINAIQNPSLTLVKTGVFNDENENGRADSGETISYTFLVTNTGNVSLTNVTVSDPMVTVSGGPISLAVGEDSGNTFTATYTIDQDDVNAGEVVNTASADSDETDPVDSEETTNLPQVPFLEFSKSTDTEEYSTLGEVIRYKLTLVNSGNLPIEDVEVSDPLATTGPDYLVGDLNSNGILEIGEAWIYVATVSITQKHLDDGFFINIAKATGKSVDGENLELTDQQEIKAVQKPSWTLTKSSSDTYDAAGDVLNYTIAVK